MFKNITMSEFLDKTAPDLEVKECKIDSQGT